MFLGSIILASCISNYQPYLCLLLQVLACRVFNSYRPINGTVKPLIVNTPD